MAVLPALGGEGVPWLSLAAAGVLWTMLAAIPALRGPLLAALRNE